MNNRTPEDSEQHTPKFSSLESLSALMDGENTQLELRRLLRERPDTIDESWLRFHVARAVIRQEAPTCLSVPASIALSESITAAIESEPAFSIHSNSDSDHDNKGSFQARKRQARKRIVPHAVRFGLAASVAGAVVLSAQLFLQQPSPGSVGSSFVQSSSGAGVQVLPIGGTVRPVSQATVHNPPALRPPQVVNRSVVVEGLAGAEIETLKADAARLMFEHAQNASQHSHLGILPYVRVPDAENQ